MFKFTTKSYTRSALSIFSKGWNFDWLGMWEVHQEDMGEENQYWHTSRNTGHQLKKVNKKKKNFSLNHIIWTIQSLYILKDA